MIIYNVANQGKNFFFKKNAFFFFETKNEIGTQFYRFIFLFILELSSFE